MGGGAAPTCYFENILPKTARKKMKEFEPWSACSFGSATDLSRDEEKSHSKNLTKLERGDEKFLLGR